MRGPGEVSDDRHPALAEAIKHFVDVIVKEVGLCLRYHAVAFRGGAMEELACLGGGARNQMLIDSLGEELKLKTIVGNPLRHLSLGEHAGVDRRGEKPEWATSTGLALRGLYGMGAKAGSQLAEAAA